ncbi:MAG: hypothetical protein K5668_09670 [Lachnospiraceae bacterium]|nr:hypothetical protein [Lachnospiraceae bacterium]
MRRQRRGKNDILIDLTSLLDVIFILLMVVLARQQVSGMNLTKQQEELDKMRAECREAETEAEEKYKLYSEQLSLAEKTVIITVTAAFDPEEPKNRTLRILKNGNANADEFSLSGGNTEDAYKAFEEKMSEYVSSADGLPVTLSIADDGSEILYRDQQRIQSVFNALQSGSGDIYIRAMSGEKEE